MLFGRRSAGVATPVSNAAQTPSTAVATPQPADPLAPSPAPLQLVEPSNRELVRAIAQLGDDVKWLAERFEKLQNRVTTELREIRREVDRFYDEPEEE